jgi:glycosyltransferase involved in cell wall biosynthesis
MKITFFSNFLNHHEIPFCDALYNLIGDGFCFVQTEQMHQERINMGWGQENDKIPYLKILYTDKTAYNECIQLGKESDVVILGSAPYEFIADRVKNNKLTFYYAERLFRKSFLRAFYPPSTLKILKRFIRPGWNSNFYMLCASGYTSYDVSRIHTFEDRCFRWGHFPEFIEYDIDKLIESKQTETIELLWAGRFIDCKHPQYPILVAKKLKQENIKFRLNIIGTGELESELVKLIENNKLYDCVELLGSMEPISVRRYMEKADIYLFTSDFGEGWGAVLYEAMNSGCAVVASHAIGAVPHMLQHRANGLIYKNADFNDLYVKVKELIENKNKREYLGRNAYTSLNEQWKGEVAAKRFYDFAYSALIGDNKPEYENGTMSVAPKLKNNWFTKG